MDRAIKSSRPLDETERGGHYRTGRAELVANDLRIFFIGAVIGQQS